VSERPTGTALGDELELVLVGEPVGLPCDELARLVHRRRRVVLATLRAQPRFVHEGRTRRSRWRVVAQEGRGRNGAGGGRNDLPWAGLDASGVPLAGRRPQRA
jgi:hypothetical protein